MKSMLDGLVERDLLGRVTPTMRPRSSRNAPRHPRSSIFFGRIIWRINVYAGEIEVRPPGARTIRLTGARQLIKPFGGFLATGLVGTRCYRKLIDAKATWREGVVVGGSLREPSRRVDRRNNRLRLRDLTSCGGAVR